MLTNCPLDYSLCCQTVTIYRKQGDSILRQAAENCYLEARDQRVTDTLGSRGDFSFLLVMPGPDRRVFPGDRVMAGEGPEVSLEDWDGFIPAKVPGLYEVEYAAPYTWEGETCHVEAGRRRL